MIRRAVPTLRDDLQEFSFRGIELMKRTRFVARVSAVLAALLSGPVWAGGAGRFDGEGIELLKQVSEGYDLNEGNVAPGKFDDEVLGRLQSSADPSVRELARLLPQMKELHGLSRQQNARTAQTLLGQVKSLPLAAAERVIEAMKAPEDEQNDIRSAAKTLEAFMGSNRPDEINPQTQMNKSYALIALGNGMAMSLMQKLAAYAHEGSNPGAGVGSSAASLMLDVRLNDDPRRAGTVKITNLSGKPLTNCLVITRLEADKPRVAAMAKQEDTFGKLVLPALGLSGNTVSGSRLAARLRYIYFGQDKGGIAFIPEFPTGGTVTVNFASPAHYSISKSATASVWCDEGMAEGVSVKNWPPAAGNAPRRAVLGNPAARSAADDDPRNGQCRKCNTLFNVSPQLAERQENVRCPRCKTIMSARRAIAWRDAVRARQRP
jgi:hypothetical protein